MICTVVAERSYDAATQQVKGFCEWRLDYLDEINSEHIRKIIQGKKVILTLRPTWCGGKFHDESQRTRYLMEIMKLSPFCVDLELHTRGIAELVSCAQKHGVKYILSYHNFGETPPLETLHSIYKEARQFNPFIVKIVTTANSLEDNLTILRFNLEAGSDIISFCMGDQGILTRIFCTQYGSVFTYGGEKNETAPGQLSTKELSHLYTILGWSK
jgi:3-dehydroquinate dehydratase type I